METAEGRVSELKTGLESGRDKRMEEQRGKQKKRKEDGNRDKRGRWKRNGEEIWQIEERRYHTVENGV